MKWLTPGRLFVLILFIAIFTLSVREITDNDFWWHLRTGQLIVESKTIPKNDPFSYTNPGKDWITHEWLSELIIYMLFRLGGINVLILVFSSVITFSFGLVYLRCRGKPYLAGFILFLGVIATAPTWGVRPQMFSLLFASLYLFLLDRFSIKKKLMYLMPIPVIMILWVNMHASYALGIVIVIISLVGQFTDTLIQNWRSMSPHKSLWKELYPILFTFILCLLAVLFNPNGIQMITYPFETLSSFSMQTYIQEWFSPNFHLMEWQPLALLILLLMGSGFFSNQSISISEIGLVIIFGYASLVSMRHVYFFALTAVPLIDKSISRPRLEKAPPDFIIKSYPFINTILLICVLFVATIRINQIVSNQTIKQNDVFPEVASKWIEQNNPQGNIFNSYNWGGYLIWRLYPEYRVFIDGRADIYGDSDMVRYAQLYSGINWQEIFQEYDIRFVLVEPTAPIASILLETSGWQKTIEESNSILLVQTEHQ
jgi:hypothetical protein